MHPKDYNVQIKIRNNFLLRAMRLNGFENAAQLSRASGVSQSSIGLYLNLKITPKGKRGKWRYDIQRLADFLKFLPEDLFPPQHIENPLKKNVGEVELSFEDIGHLVSAGSYSSEEDRFLEEETGDLRDKLQSALAELSPKAHKIMIKRFGLFGVKQMSLEETAKDFCLTSARIRQIEKSALRKLGHPNRRDKMKEVGEFFE